MYQRYNKQRKFGRIFSFCMVIGSGLSHYVKTSKQSVKNLFKIENLSKYDEYFPDYVNNVIENIKGFKEADAYTKLKNELNDVREDNIFISRKFREDKFILKNKFWIYKNNLDRSNIEIQPEYTEQKKNQVYSKQILAIEDVKNRETYKLYRYFKNL